MFEEQEWDVWPSDESQAERYEIVPGDRVICEYCKTNYVWESVFDDYPEDPIELHAHNLIPTCPECRGFMIQCIFASD